MPTDRMRRHLDAMVARRTFRRAAPVRARSLGLPAPRPRGRPAGTDPPARDRAARRVGGRASSEPGPGSRRAVDLGTGTGAIGLALADELPVVGTEVWLTDVLHRRARPRPREPRRPRPGGRERPARSGSVVRRAARRACASTPSSATRPTSPRDSPDLEDAGARVGAGRRVVRRARRSRSHPAPRRRSPCSSRPGRAPPPRDRSEPGRRGPRAATPMRVSLDVADPPRRRRSRPRRDGPFAG